MRRSVIVASLCGLVLFAGLAAQGAEPAELRKLFPQEAAVFVEGDGLSRLVLTPEILAACRPDLSDLRLFDAEERETAFLVDAGRLPRGVVETFTQRVEPRLVEAARQEIRRESGPPLRRETFELAMPGAVPQTGNWVLIVETRAAEWVARVQVEGVGAGGETTALVTDGSIFRLGGTLPAQKLRLPLPPFGGPRLRIVLETEHPFWLEPAFRLESARALERGGRIAVPLEILSSRGGDGRTVVDLVRPGGIVPDLLRIETKTGTFDRKVEVWDAGPGSAETALGSSRLFRVEALSFAGESEVVLSPARGDRLRIEIDDGDSPALEELAFAAVIRQPSLVFSLKGGRPGEPAGTLRFGGGRAQPPRYDLARLLPRPGATGKRAEAAALLYDDSVVRPALIGTVGANLDYDGAPAAGLRHASRRRDRPAVVQPRAATERPRDARGAVPAAAGARGPGRAARRPGRRPRRRGRLAAVALPARTRGVDRLRPAGDRGSRKERRHVQLRPAPVRLARCVSTGCCWTPTPSSSTGRSGWRPRSVTATIKRWRAAAWSAPSATRARRAST